MIVVRLFFYIIIFLFSVVYFFPKDSAIEYVNEALLKKERVSIEANIDDLLYIWEAKNSKVLIKQDIVANAGDFEVLPFLVYNDINIKNIKLYGFVAPFFPTPIDKININYNIFSDLYNIHLSANGVFGSAKGIFSIKDQKMRVEITPSKMMTSSYMLLLNQCKKENNIYVYEFKL